MARAVAQRFWTQAPKRPNDEEPQNQVNWINLGVQLQTRFAENDCCAIKHEPPGAILPKHRAKGKVIGCLLPSLSLTVCGWHSWAVTSDPLVWCLHPPARIDGKPDRHMALAIGDKRTKSTWVTMRRLPMPRCKSATTLTQSTGTSTSIRLPAEFEARWRALCSP